MCVVRVVQVFGLTDGSGEVVALIADGTTEDCNQVDVTLEHTDSGATTPSRRFTANAAGQWRARFDSADGDFDARDFPCGRITQGSLRVQAACFPPQPNCQDTAEFKELACGTTTPPLPPPPEQPIQPCPDTSVPAPGVSEDCVGDRRVVVFSAEVEPQPNTTVSARLVLQDEDGQTIEVIDEAFGQTADFSLGGQRELTAGDYFARVEVTRPNYCGGNDEPFTVPRCDGVPDPPDRPDDSTTPETPAPQDGGSSDGFIPCLLFKILALLGLGILILGAILLFCPPVAKPIPTGVAVGIGIALAIGGAGLMALGLILWFLLCQPTGCDWAAFAWQGLVLIGLMMIYAGYCPACSWMLLGVILLVGGAYAAFQWERECRASRCRFLSEWISLFTIVVNVVAVLEIALALCVITTRPVPAFFWALFIAAIQAWLWYEANRNNCIRS